MSLVFFAGRQARSLPALALLLAVAGCSDGDGARSSALPSVIEVRAPDRPVEQVDVVEDLSEQVAHRLVDLAETLRRRRFNEAAAWLGDDFAGHALDSCVPGPPESLPLGAQRVVFDVAGAAVVGRQAWLDSLAAWLSSWGSLERVVLKVKEAEFQRAAAPWGRVRLRASFHGRGADQGPRQGVLWALVRVKAARGTWWLSRLEIQSLVVTSRPAAVFTDVTTSAGLAHRTGIFGRDGNDRFYWNGAASQDIDGDGLWDLFVPTTDGCFLYRNAGNGRFEQVAEEWGLARERGGTGAVFFDLDNDGDPDLAVGHVGWTRADGRAAGQPVRLYRNDGDRFVDVTGPSGLSGHHVAFSLVAGDFDGDGFTDLYVCSYNRMDAVYPESWYRAGNGTPNALYRNRGNGTFEEVAQQWGADDGRWTFAAAAADYDEDGDLDLYLANDYGDNALLVNRGDGHFSDEAFALGVLDTGNGMSAAWGDVDNDGHLDLYVANMASTAGKRILKRLVAPDSAGVDATLVKLASGNSIFRLGPDHLFERVPAQSGGVSSAWAWAAQFLDVDLDGNRDLFVANGFISGESAADT